MSGIPEVSSTVAAFGLMAGFLAARRAGRHEFGGGVLLAGHDLASPEQACTALAAGQRKP